VRRMIDDAAAGGAGYGPADAVVIDGLHKTYGGGGPAAVAAVAGVSLGVRGGEVLGLLGPNGAGKTSLAAVLTGRLPATAGDAWLAGARITAGGAAAARARGALGVCPQHDVLWGSLTPRQHMAFYGRLKGLRGPALRTAAAEALAAAGLAAAADEPAGTLSGGMRRRVSVAAALLGGPVACLLDEPTTGVDPLSRIALWRCIRSAARRPAGPPHPPSWPPL
jgi:ABC-type multidrug transport system ATPase subunit